MMTRIELLRDIATNGARRVHITGRKVWVDSFTANAMVQVHDGLNPENQAKFVSLPFLRMVDVGWKLIRGQKH